MEIFINIISILGLAFMCYNFYLIGEEPERKIFFLLVTASLSLILSLAYLFQTEYILALIVFIASIAWFKNALDEAKELNDDLFK